MTVQRQIVGGCGFVGSGDRACILVIFERSSARHETRACISGLFFFFYLFASCCISAVKLLGLDSMRLDHKGAKMQRCLWLRVACSVVSVFVSCVSCCVHNATHQPIRQLHPQHATAAATAIPASSRCLSSTTTCLLAPSACHSPPHEQLLTSITGRDSIHPRVISLHHVRVGSLHHAVVPGQSPSCCRFGQ